MSLDAQPLADHKLTPSFRARLTGQFPRPSLTTSAVASLVAAALVVTLGGIAAAVLTGANVAVAALVGYSAITSTVVLAMLARPAAPAEAPAHETPPQAERTATTSAAWKCISVLTVSDASRLWCSIEPGATATPESIAWGRALLDAIKQGDLAFEPKTPNNPESVTRERQTPRYSTQVTRAALRTWAEQKGQLPAFLQD